MEHDQELTPDQLVQRDAKRSRAVRDKHLDRLLSLPYVAGTSTGILYDYEKDEFRTVTDEQGRTRSMVGITLFR